MSEVYFELRPAIKNHTQPIAADIARHLQTRQYLGTTLVICDNPLSLLSSTRKQWLRLARNLQKQRASTLNAEEILRFTHTIMHMQNMIFTARTPAETSDAQVYFITTEQLLRIPRNCFTVYLMAQMTSKSLKKVLPELPHESLIVNYDTGIALSPLGLLPKSKLDAKVQKEWSHLCSYMQKFKINPNNLVTNNSLQLGAIDDALDTLLDISNEFLREAAAFQNAMNIAQPLSNVSATQHRQFETITRLAHRVQALTPGSFSNYLIKTFGEKDASTYFLRDAAPEDDELFQNSDISGYILFENEPEEPANTKLPALSKKAFR